MGIVETHLDGDPLSGLIPRGYRCLSRLDRSKNGSGLFWLGRRHLLVDKINMKPYNVVNVSEILGIE